MNKMFYIIGGGIIMLLGVMWFFLSPSDEVVVPVTLSDRAGTDPAIKVIAFGDSLTAGFGLPSGEAYPAQLEQRLLSAGYDVEVINAGVSGETTAGNKERATFIASQEPDIVLLGTGGNDALRALSVVTMEENLRSTIVMLQNSATPPVILLLQMQAPLNSGLGYKREFDAVYENVADDMGLILVPFITAGLFLDRDNKLPDGIHYNALGYEKVVDQYVMPALEEVLEG
jgi:acyl-CoA thioesterase-1